MTRPVSTLIALLALALVAPAVAAPSLILPNETSLVKLIASDPTLGDEIAEVAQGLGYVPTLTAYARVQAARALKSGHLVLAAKWKLIHGKLARGKAVEVEPPATTTGVPWTPGEKVNFDLSAEVPIIGNTKVGRAWQQSNAAILEEGKVSLHVTAEVIVERFSPQKNRQEIYANAETLLIERSDVTRFDGSGNVTDKYTDTFDHEKHQTVRTRPNQAPQTSVFSAQHTLSSMAWFPYAARIGGFDVGTSWNLVLVEDAVPFALKVTGKTAIGADKVFALSSTPSRVNAWIFDNARRLPRRVTMLVDMASSADDGFFSNRKVTLDFRSVEGVAEDSAD